MEKLNILHIKRKLSFSLFCTTLLSLLTKRCQEGPNAALLCSYNNNNYTDLRINSQYSPVEFFLKKENTKIDLN